MLGKNPRWQSVEDASRFVDIVCLSTLLMEFPTRNDNITILNHVFEGLPCKRATTVYFKRCSIQNFLGPKYEITFTLLLQLL